MNTSTTPARRRVDRGADVGAAIGLLLLQALVLALIFAKWFTSGWSFDPGRPGVTDSLTGYLWAAGAVGLTMPLSAAVAARRGASVTAWAQGCLAALLAVVLWSGAVYQQREDQRKHPSEPTFSGQVGCRSGGDNSECEGTSG
ncbi:DUF6234 family protein [Streptomyces sp. NPDC002446]